MERDGSLHGLENFDKLSLEKAMTLDVEDLDDEGWRIASHEKRIIELGSLGEGAGGAVTRCKLKGGKTVFALKVRRVAEEHPKSRRGRCGSLTTVHRLSPQTQTPT
jgi:mitogen-activated protein kinase kinase